MQKIEAEVNCKQRVKFNRRSWVIVCQLVIRAGYVGSATATALQLAFSRLLSNANPILLRLAFLLGALHISLPLFPALGFMEMP